MSKIHVLNITKKTKKNYKKACERHQNLSKEEKEKKRQYDRKGYENASEVENLG